MNALIRHTMCALIPSGGALPGVAECGVDAWIVRFRAETSLMMWIGVVLGSVVFVLTPVWTLGLPVPSVWLGPERLDAHASRLGASSIYPLRQLVLLVKMMACLCWGVDPKVRAVFALAPYPPDPGTWRS